MNPARLKAYIYLLIVALIWGAAIPIIKYTFGGFSPSVFLTYRFGISTIIAIIIFTISGFGLPKSPKLILLVFLYGFLNSVVSLGLLFFGMENTTALETGLINVSAPLIISVAGVYFLHEHITKREKIGMGIAIFGTVITILGPLIMNGHSEIRFSGNILVFGYVLTTVITSVLVKELLRKDVNPLALTNFSFAIGFICFLGYLLFTRSLPSLTTLMQIPYTYHLGVLYMAVLSGSLAFYLGNKAQKTIEIGEQSLFSYINPIIALPLAVLWLEEKITYMNIIGGIIIIIGVVIAEVKKSKTSR